MGKSPPESGGDPSRSEGGAVCLKVRALRVPYEFPRSDPCSNRCATRIFTRNALRANFEQIFRLRPVGLALRPGPRCARASPPNLGVEFAPSQHLRVNYCESYVSVAA